MVHNNLDNFWQLVSVTGRHTLNYIHTHTHLFSCTYENMGLKIFMYKNWKQLMHLTVFTCYCRSRFRQQKKKNNLQFLRIWSILFMFASIGAVANDVRSPLIHFVLSKIFVHSSTSSKDGSFVCKKQNETCLFYTYTKSKIRSV